MTNTATDTKEHEYEEIVMEGETVDSRTGEIIAKGKPNTLGQAGNILQLQINANVIGTLELSPETEKILDEKLDPQDVKIRPDGLVYLPWTWYASRLNRAFGRLKWGLVPQGAPQSKETGKDNVLVIWGNWLIIKGIPVGFAVGETSYKTNNYTMSYGDAIAGAQSISLARNCKVLGMSLELWDSAWVESWKKEYTETYKGNNDKTLWRKRGQKPVKAESKEIKESTVVSKVVDTAITGDFETDFPPIKFTAKQIRNSADHIANLSKQSGKTVTEVLSFIKTLDSAQEFSISKLSELIKGEK